MKSQILTWCLCALVVVPSLLLFATPALAQDAPSVDAPLTTLVVAPDGDDANPGTVDLPMATLRAATSRLAATAGGEATQRTVILRGGVYEMTTPLQLTAAHSGITITAAAGEQPILSGGRRVTQWRLVDQGLWVADMPRELADAPRPSALYLDGRRVSPARFPNHGFMKVRQSANNGRVLAFNVELPVASEHAGEVVVLQQWSAVRVPLSEIAADHATAATTISSPHQSNRVRSGSRAFVQFAHAALDAGYEWAANADARQILLRLPAEVDPNHHEIIAPVLPQLVAITGQPSQPVTDVTLRGVRLMYASWLPPEDGYRGRQATYFNTSEPRAIFAVPAAVWLSDATNCRLEGVSVQHVSGGGIALGRGTQRVVIDQCVIDDVGGNGVMVGWRTADGLKRVGALDADWSDEADVPTGNTITGSLVQRCGEELPGAVGIWVAFAAETRIAGNLVRDLPYTGISLGFKWNSQRTSMRGSVVEANRITNVMRLLGDGGGIYTLGSQPDTIIRHNVIHGVHRHNDAEGSPNNGIFVDEGSQHLAIDGNVIYHTSGSAIRLHNAKRDEQVWGENSIGQGATLPPDAPEEVVAAAGPAQSLLDWAAVMLSREPWPIEGPPVDVVTPADSPEAPAAEN